MTQLYDPGERIDVAAHSIYQTTGTGCSITEQPYELELPLLISASERELLADHKTGQVSTILDK